MPSQKKITNKNRYVSLKKYLLSLSLKCSSHPLSLGKVLISKTLQTHIFSLLLLTITIQPIINFQSYKIIEKIFLNALTELGSMIKYFKK